jgi:hypothetical protein
MKNIFNLLTDAFDRIGKIETNYYVVVSEYYKIKITSREASQQGEAELTLIMRNNGDLYDYRDVNTLFTEQDWDSFCRVIEQQIPSSFITAGQLLNLQSLINHVPTQNPFEDDINNEIGDLLINNYVNLTVDTNIPNLFDMDDFTDDENQPNQQTSENIYNIH